MFDRVFKKKDEPTFTDLTRRNRVDKQKAAEYLSRRPRTAPATPRTVSPTGSDETTRVINYRHSLGDVSLSPHRVIQEPFRFTAPEGSPPEFSMLPPPTHPLNPRKAPAPAAPTVPSVPVQRRTPPPPPSPVSREESPCPRMVPRVPSASNELRNPFRRSGTADSVTSMARTESCDSFADTGVPVHRTVRAFRPARPVSVDSADHQPLRAAIFTTVGQEQPIGPLAVPPSTAGVISDPFTDSHAAASQPASPSASAMGGLSLADDSPRNTRSRWSSLRRASKQGRDFLQVNIPTGVMSPVRESRLAFWSKA
ncbi:hypothetical protein C8Q79DRAFT_956664 [Trametes meyenii]|nr:hypothetical protein C8Q79DRAFT_956664 [Trametes meyenii]